MIGPDYNPMFLFFLWLCRSQRLRTDNGDDDVYHSEGSSLPGPLYVCFCHLGFFGFVCDKHRAVYAGNWFLVYFFSLYPMEEQNHYTDFFLRIVV